MQEIVVKKSLRSPVFSFRNKVLRVVWGAVYLTFFRFSPVPFFGFRRWVLRLFGAKIAADVNVYPSAKIWLPTNLVMASGSTLGPSVNIYNQGSVSIGSNAILSQGAYVCASTHDYNDPVHPLVLMPVVIGNNAWVCADAFIGPGVNVAEGGVVGARAVVSKNTEDWSVYAGNPAAKVNKRNRFS